MSPVNLQWATLPVIYLNRIRVILKKTIQHGTLLHQFRLNRTLLHRLLHGVHHLLLLGEISGFFHEVISGPGFECLPRNSFASLAGVKDDGHGRKPCAHIPQDVQAVPAWKLIVQHQGIDMLFLK